MILVTAIDDPAKVEDIALLRWRSDGKMIYASDDRLVGTQRSARIARLIVQDHNAGL